MAELRTWCRLSECGIALKAEVDGDHIKSLVPDDQSPMGKGSACGLCTNSMAARTDRRRLTRPLRRTGDRWEEVSWEQALDEIAAKLKEIRGRTGPRSLGLYAGAPLGLHLHGVVRSLAVALGWGTPSLFSPLSVRGGPWLRATELVLGRIAPLQGDIGRTHYLLLLGANQEAQGVGPLQEGPGLLAELAFSRKTKNTKVVAVDPRRTPLAAGADLHLKCLPGTELYFLLGMIQAILQNRWYDEQYVRDYTTGFADIQRLLTPWTLERCASACGLAPADIQAVALKFSRAAMALGWRSEQSLNSTHGTLTAWALLVLHALTANLLRPGGIYENRGVFDFRPVASRLPTHKAPRSRVGGYPLLLLQAPGSILAEELSTPGEGQLRALICLHGDPLREQPGGDQLARGLQDLELLVCTDLADNHTTKLAHWVLPSTHAWERSDLRLLDSPLLPYRTAARTDALVSAPGEAKGEDWILAELFRRVGPSWRGGHFGPHLRLMGGALATANLEKWQERAWDERADSPLNSLKPDWNGGDVDRATWRPGHEDGRFHLLPPPISEALSSLSEPVWQPGLPLRLLSSAARDMALRAFDRPTTVDPGVTLHPSLGFTDGQRVRIRTEAGQVEATVHLDANMQAATVDLPSGYEVDVMRLIPTGARDPFTGTPALNGLPCAVEAL